MNTYIENILIPLCKFGISYSLFFFIIINFIEIKMKKKNENQNDDKLFKRNNLFILSTWSKA